MKIEEWNKRILDRIKAGLSPEAEKELLDMLGREFDEPTDDYENLWEDIFGKRQECPTCGSLILPELLCWGCEEWTAPKE